MKNKKVICLVLCGVVFAALGVIGVWRSHREPRVTRCLLIGCDRFVSMPGTEPASANNVETMAALLSDFLPEDTAEDTLIIRQVNGPGTVAGFEQLVADAFRRANGADTCIVYLSTHGVLRKNAQCTMHNEEWGTETEDSGYEMVLLLSDGEEEEYLTPEKLRETMDQLPGEKILILDACHSGAVIGQGWEEGNPFEGSDCRVLVSSGAMEESWFWNTETDGYTGTGYFTAAMENALRASDPEQIAPEGKVSLKSLAARLREIHGASTVYCWPEDSEETLFRLPADRKAGSHLQGVAFGEAERDGDAVILPIRYRAGEAVRVMYQLVPGRNGSWDFEHAVRLPDREKTGLIRGLVSPGGKERKIRLTVKSLGEDGKALMQIITYSADGTTISVEAGTVITIQNSEFIIQN